ncbi:MAG TPA: hypothetical protein QGG70_03265 [Candidatus Pacearchaeota archaeon]|jgi:hypothetical protein|nr:hypothetical protein [Candidatus Pacearchaeota archaeon]
MKRVLSLFLILFLLISISLTIAQENDLANQETKDIIEQGIQNDILIPGFLTPLAKTLFKLDSPIYLSQFIILSCLFLLILLFLYNIIRISDFPGGKLVSFTVILIITLIGSSAGGLTLIGNIYLSALYKIQLFEKWPVFGIAFSLILFLFLLWAISLLSRFSKKQQQEEEAFKEGVEMNKTLTIIKRMAKMAG